MQAGDMRKVAIPIENDVLSKVFNHATHFKIFTIKVKKITDEKLVSTQDHQLGLFPFWLRISGITDVIVYKIHHQTINKFNCMKINVFVGVEKEDPILLINDFIKGELETNAEVCDNENQLSHK